MLRGARARIAVTRIPDKSPGKKVATIFEISKMEAANLDAANLDAAKSKAVCDRELRGQQFEAL